MTKILIVEDDPMVAELNSRLIQTMEGFSKPIVIGDAKEALTYLEKNPVDMILLDIYLPGMNGLELLSRIRELNYPVDVLVVSAARDSHSIQTALRAGAVDYLIKPFDFDRLRQALQAYAHRSRLIREHESLTQKDLDVGILPKETAEPEGNQALPKGLDRYTLALITQCLREIPEPFTTEELSRKVGLSRVSIRKYLEFFCEIGQLTKEVAYGGWDGQCSVSAKQP
jgi:CitB family two-component system response regulator MalR